MNLKEEFKDWLRSRYHPLQIPCNNMHFAQDVWEKRGDQYRKALQEAEKALKYAMNAFEEGWELSDTLEQLTSALSLIASIRNETETK